MGLHLASLIYSIYLYLCFYGFLYTVFVICKYRQFYFFSNLNAFYFISFYFIFVVTVVHSLSHVRLFATPWTVACQASLSFTTSQSSLKLMSIVLVVPSHHFIFCHPLLLLPSFFPSIRVFSNGSVLLIR